MNLVLTAQENDTLDEKIKSGWTFGALPAVAYDADLGFRYGALVNFFNYGDGSTYPKYLQSIYYEWSRTTRGSTLNKFYFDSDQILKEYYLRLTASFNNIDDKAFDFYGFNGYESVYHPEWEDKSHEDYRSRMFYRLERNRTNLTFDFQGAITSPQFRWLLGYSWFNFKLSSVNIDQLNKGKDESDKLPSLDSVPGLYERYINWGLIAPSERNGGYLHFLKTGLVFDSRDIEANPMRGIWTEASVVYAPASLNSGEKHFVKLNLIHRQYFTLITKRLSLAYRIGIQNTISGYAPHYIQPFLYDSWPNSAYSEGIGGGKNVRGILRNRIVGDGIAYANIEVRWKFWKGLVFDQNIYLALAPFYDAGLVSDKISVDYSKVPDDVDFDHYFDPGADGLHSSAGAGFYAALNQNFIVSVMYGKAFNQRDGDDGLYININFLF
jgi:hypothetical protein